MQKPKGNWKEIQQVWFKVRDSRLKDPAFLSLSNAEWGVYSRLECLASQQPERGKIAVNSEKPRKVLGNLLGIDERFVAKYLEKYAKLELIFIDPDTWEIDCIHWKLNQEPLSNTERSRIFREAQAQRKCNASVTGDATQEIRVDEKKHSSNNVFPESTSFLDNKGDISEKVTLGAAPFHQSPDTEKEKDASKEKEEVAWTLDLIPPPSTEQVKDSDAVRSGVLKRIAKYTNLIKERPGSSGIFWIVRELTDGPGGNSTQALVQIERSLRRSHLYAEDEGKGHITYFRLEMKEREEHDKKAGIVW